MAKKFSKVEEYIYKHKQVTVKEIMETFSLSESTVRRYINELLESNSVKKEYGYVIANSADNLVSIRERINHLSEQKTKIAELTHRLIHDGDTIFIDSGTTHMPMASMLFKKKNLTIVTNNLLFAIKVVDSDLDTNLFMIPGNVNSKTISVSGDLSTSYLNRFFFDISFITASGISIENGLSNRTLPECEIKRQLIKRSKTTVIMVDNTKYDRIFPFSFGAITDFDYLFTDKKPDQKYLTLAANSKLKIVWSEEQLK
jgi:DeoR family myo-inositol catabolism operon transcriptional repressor